MKLLGGIILILVLIVIGAYLYGYIEKMSYDRSMHNRYVPRSERQWNFIISEDTSEPNANSRSDKPVSGDADNQG